MKSKMATDNNDVEDMMVDVANGIDNVTLDDDMNGIGTGISEPHDTEDLPTALIITNVDLQVFEDPNEKVIIVVCQRPKLALQLTHWPCSIGAGRTIFSRW